MYDVYSVSHRGSPGRCCKARRRPELHRSPRETTSMAFFSSCHELFYYFSVFVVLFSLYPSSFRGMPHVACRTCSMFSPRYLQQAKPLVLLSLLREMVGKRTELCVVFTSSVDSTHRLFRLLQLFGGEPWMLVLVLGGLVPS